MPTLKRKSFFKEMLNCKNDIQSTRNVEAGKLYLKIQTFVESGVYDYYKKADVVAKLLLEGYNVPYVSSSLGCSESAVRTHINEMSIELYDIFGDNFFQHLIKYPKDKTLVDVVMSNISSYSVSSQELLPAEYTVLLDGVLFNADKCDFDLKDCSREISFLSRFAKETFKKGLVTINPNKMRFILDCINHKAGTSPERVAVLKAITGKEIE